MQYPFYLNSVLIELIIYGFDPIEEIEVVTSSVTNDSLNRYWWRIFPTKILMMDF